MRRWDDRTDTVAWRFELRVQGESSSRELADWENQLPAEAATCWLFAEESSRLILVDPAEARAQPSGNPRFSCACCGYRTLSAPTHETHEVCAICFWEDDPIQFRDPDHGRGANRTSLREARQSFERIGACEEEMLPHVRKPRPSDERSPS
ncbi:MAG: hypothetical protein KDB53_01630 [Planctomycetes bacterium]|nr:hypothetical protein [Planctomycetota bacterium]